MASNSAFSPTLSTDAELFYQYLGQRLSSGAREEPIEHLLTEFTKYRRELEKACTMIREAEEASARGESVPLDLGAVLRRGRERMAAEGIFD
jgi:hypothetical protein